MTEGTSIAHVVPLQRFAGHVPARQPWLTVGYATEHRQMAEAVRDFARDRRPRSP